MRRYPAALAVMILLGGCRAPMPTFNMLAPYGATRVPPPATGSFGTPDAYYQTPAYPPPGSTTPTSAVGSGLRATPPLGSDWSASTTAPDRTKVGVPTPARAQLASFVEDGESTGASKAFAETSRVRIVDGSAGGSTTSPRESSLSLQSKPIEISDLPPAIQSKAITTRTRLSAAPINDRIVRGNTSNTWRPRTLQ